MKSNRMRVYKPVTGIKERFRFEAACHTSAFPINLEDLPAPLPIAKISPDQLIEDILVSTLRRLQENSSPEVTAAAARYISLLSEKAL
jgi:hypothetical protein